MNIPVFTAILVGCLALPGCSGGGSAAPETDVASVGDDDTYPTIQAAIDAAPEGATIRIGAGVHTEILHLSKRVTLRGERGETTIRTHGSRRSRDDDSDDTLAGLTIRNADGVTIEDLEFSGNPEDGIVIRNSSNIVLRGVVAIGNGDDGIDIRDSVAITIGSSETRPCQLRENGDRGILVRSSSNVSIEDAEASGNVGDGIRIRESQETVVTGILATSNLESGVRVRDAAEVTLQTCTISGNREYGVRLGSAPSTVVDGIDYGVGNGRGNLRRD